VITNVAVLEVEKPKGSVKADEVGMEDEMSNTMASERGE